MIFNDGSVRSLAGAGRILCPIGSDESNQGGNPSVIARGIIGAGSSAWQNELFKSCQELRAIRQQNILAFKRYLEKAVSDQNQSLWADRFRNKELTKRFPASERSCPEVDLFRTFFGLRHSRGTLAAQGMDRFELHISRLLVLMEVFVGYSDNKRVHGDSNAVDNFPLGNDWLTSLQGRIAECATTGGDLLFRDRIQLLLVDSKVESFDRAYQEFRSALHQWKQQPGFRNVLQRCIVKSVVLRAELEELRQIHYAQFVACRKIITDLLGSSR